MYSAGGCGILVVVIAASGIFKSDCPVTTEKKAIHADFLQFKKCLLGLRSSPAIRRPWRKLLPLSFIRYYTQRQCKVIFDKPAWRKLMPAALLHIDLYNNPASEELHQVLIQNITSVYL